MYNAKAYSAASATSPLASTTNPAARANRKQQKLTGRRPNIEDIADALHISSRALQRRLQDQGSSLQRLLEEARHQLARHYLNNSFLELNEAAYLLGYEDGNSFVRAFRNWEGVSPSLWREQQRARQHRNWAQLVRKINL